MDEAQGSRFGVNALKVKQTILKCIQCMSNEDVKRYEILYISAINSYIIKESADGKIFLCDKCTKKTKNRR